MDILTEIISDCSELKKSIPSKGIVNRYPLSTDKFQSILNSMKKLDYIFVRLQNYMKIYLLKV